MSALSRMVSCIRAAETPTHAKLGNCFLPILLDGPLEAIKVVPVWLFKYNIKDEYNWIMQYRFAQYVHLWATNYSQRSGEEWKMDKKYLKIIILL